MLDYQITGVYFKGADPIVPDFTDFTDFPACFDALQESLFARPGAHMAMNFSLLHENPDDDESITIRYGYPGTQGHLVVSIAGEEGSLTQGYLLDVNRDTGKFKVIRRDGRDDDEAVDEAVKIILEYGSYVTAGIGWGAYLLHENANGRLKQFFDSTNQEIH